MNSSPLVGVVVGHGTVAGALVAAAEEITGIRGLLVSVSNTNCDRATLEERVVEAIGDREALVFVDLPSGSCFHASLRRMHGHTGIQVVTGVNLAMLLDFLFHRDEPPTGAASRAVATGVRAIQACPSS